MRSSSVWIILAFAGAMAGCATSRDTAKGFRLAAGDADTHRGRAAFLEFGCNSCHEVQGAKMPPPTIQRVVLGGSVLATPSDGYLVTAIINPAYHAAAHPPPPAVAAVHPRMPDYASRMTCQQLTDIVVYLQTRYALRPAPVPPEFP